MDVVLSVGTRISHDYTEFTPPDGIRPRVW